MRSFVALVFVLCGYIGFSQFSFSVTPTDETCTGNGTLTFNLSNQNPNASYTFALYKLPNTATTYLVTSSLFVEYLANGTYRIDAIENLNGTTTIVSKEVVIADLVEPLTYIINEIPTDCSGITIEVVTLTGQAVAYEIFSGPTTYALQDSNIFTGLLTEQTYQIRIYDACGEGYTRTHTIELETSFAFDYVESLSTLISCDTYRAGFIIYSVAEHQNVEVNYNITLPDGSVEVVTDLITIPVGTSTTYIEIPFFSAEVISIEVSVLDCLIHNVIEVVPSIGFQEGRDECGEVYFAFTIQNYFGPYNINFTEFPDGFIPSDYNANHPTHTDNYILYGMQDNPMPFGEYSIVLTDSCGNSFDYAFESIYKDEKPILGYGNNGCGQFTGYFGVKFQTDRVVVAATITDGPASLGPYPIDISDFINEDGELRVIDFPEGDYTIVFTDSCGFEYEEEISIPENTLHDFNFYTYLSCNDLEGTLRLSTPNGGVLVSAIIIAAPDAFPYALPYDATGDISSSGELFFASLSMGYYTIAAVDSCNYSLTETYFVRGDVFNEYPYIVVDKNCNIFDLNIDDTSPTYSINTQYWLQYFNETTQTWGHPYTGAAYESGEFPTEDNSLKLIIVEDYELLNVGIFGKFRILKTYRTIIGIAPYRTENCIKENYYTFDYYRDLTILNAYRIICEDQTQSVVIQAQGVPPISYFITTKNGQPFEVDNQHDNVFTGLVPGVYNFQVRDNCGNIRNREFNLNEIELMVTSGKVEDIIECSDTAFTEQEFYLPNKNQELVAATLSLDYFTMSYHLSYQDATNSTNALPDYYTVQSGSNTRIYVRIENDLVPDCFNIAYFDLVLIQTPDISDITTDHLLCEGQSITLSVDAIYDAYLWQDGSTGNSLEVAESGTYKVMLSTTYAGISCSAEVVFEVVLSPVPVIEKIEYQDWTYTDNSITIITTQQGDFLFSLDGVIYQQSNTFEQLTPGYYWIYVKDKNGCGEASSEALLLNYSRFFTPNEDGFNDYWRIQFGIFEPEMQVNIFDRYGKLLFVFMGDEPGWDGTFHNKRLPATDYWFTVERKNGVIRRGHFSLLR